MKPKLRKSRRLRWVLFIAAVLFASQDRNPLLHSSFSESTPGDLPLSLLPEPLEAKPLSLAAPELAIEKVDELKLEEKDAQAERLLRKLFTDENFGQAFNLAEKQLQDELLAPRYKAWLARQLPTLKLGAAWAQVRRQNCPDALALFDELLKTNSDPLVLKGLGFCYLQKRDWWTALTYLESYAEQKSADPEAYILLAEAKESLGALDEALSLTQKAREITSLSPDQGKDLETRERGLIARADEGQSQSEIQGGNFIIRYQPRDHIGLVEGALELLQNSEQQLVQNLGFNSPEHPIEVIFHRVENFAQAAHSPTWASGIYDGRIRIPVPEGQELNDSFARVLRHELAHALLSEQVNRRTLPTWFQEGLAQVAECPNFCWNYSFAATQQPFLKAEMFAASFLQLQSSEAQVAYKQSFYLFQVLYRINGLLGIRQIIEGLPQLRSLEADVLLGQNQLSFDEIYQKAQSAWQRQTSY